MAGDDVPTAATGLPMLIILLHMATTILHLRMGTLLCIQRTPTTRRIGITDDRTTLPIIDSQPVTPTGTPSRLDVEWVASALIYHQQKAQDPIHMAQAASGG